MRFFGREIPLTRKLRVALVLASFSVGLVIFFPIESLESRLNDSLSRTLRMEVRITNPRLGLGLRTGLMKGGLIGLKAERLEITPSRSGQSFQCLQPVVSPKLLALLILRAQVAIRCDLGESVAPLSLVIRAPLYNTSAASAEVIFDEVAMNDLATFASIKGLSGLLSGSLHAEGFLNDEGGMSVSWDLSGSEIQTPAVVSDFASLPPLNFDSVETEGSYQTSRLKVDRLVLGNDKTGPFYADLKIDFGLSPEGLPVSGFLSGKQKSDAAFEKAELSSINLDLLFGKLKPSGLREFRKEVQGSPMSLLMPVED